MMLSEDLKKLNLSTNVPLRGYTSFRIGGTASIFVEIDDIPALQECVRICGKHATPLRVLGGGTNLLIADTMMPVPVIKLAGAEFRKMAATARGIEAGASVTVPEALRWMVREGFSGAEFLAGIPATIGGALAMNASAFGMSIADHLLQVTVIDGQGQERILTKPEITFSYRYSSAREHVIVKALFDFPRLSKEAFSKKIRQIVRYRMSTQELNARSAGCIFKNPPGKTAGFLIEQSGLKGTRCRDACVSEKHANFIVNRGNASYKDVTTLIQRVKETVRRKTGIELEEEVVRWNA